MVDYQGLIVRVPIDEVIPLDCQTLEIEMIDLAELFNAGEAIMTDWKVRQIGKELNAIESGQIVVAQKQLLNFRKLLAEVLLLLLGLGPVELERGDLLVIEG